LYSFEKVQTVLLAMRNHVPRDPHLSNYNEEVTPLPGVNAAVPPWHFRGRIDHGISN